MERKFKGLQIFLVIAISFLILAPPAYLRFAKSSESDFVSSDLTFENPDQRDKEFDSGKALNTFGPSVSSINFFPDSDLIMQSFHFFQETSSPRQKAFVLRC
jgi:hypothetical protein